ncbi:hypothetical protein F4775DRAFT_559045 [Biscogniauxia sp. FL1348]|nr:hypothetical protein F4775DRAFT_559045 [Biscogniauxia sp. FL1348]
MATTNANSQGDPFEILSQMQNEVLVLMGKHLRNLSTKDGSRMLREPNEAVRQKATSCLATYHHALDDIEIEIITAKSALMRDLEKLRAARIPPPMAVAPPAPQPVAPPAPMMEMPSAAAHTMNAPSFAPKQESKTVAPFPDMGMGMSADVVDLTSQNKKPSPRVPPGALKPHPPRAAAPMKNEVKPSPKQTPKPIPAKVTPVPPPQIPRLHPPQPAVAAASAVQPKPQPAQPPQPTPAGQPAQDSSLNSMLGLPGNGASSELAFTDMQFTLAPSNNDSQGAPPAPMPEFEMTTFAPQDGNNELLSMANFNADGAAAQGEGANNTNSNNKNNSSSNTASQPSKGAEKPETNLDDLFNLDTANGGSDNMFDLGSGGVIDSTFDDIFFGNNDSDMGGQFDDAYFDP